jgi:cytochrome c5
MAAAAAAAAWGRRGAQISPCANMECWISPLSMQPQKALETIGKTLQAQYERWQPRARCGAHTLTKHTINWTSYVVLFRNAWNVFSYHVIISETS